MADTVTSPSRRVLHHRATKRTTPHEDSEAKKVRIKATKEQRVAENKEFLKNANVRAFLAAIGEAEGGGYDFKFGAVKGRKNHPWRFTDFSTHPGPGTGGTTTAAGVIEKIKEGDIEAGVAEASLQRLRFQWGKASLAITISPMLSSSILRQFINPKGVRPNEQDCRRRCIAPFRCTGPCRTSCAKNWGPLYHSEKATLCCRMARRPASPFGLG